MGRLPRFAGRNCRIFGIPENEKTSKRIHGSFGFRAARPRSRSSGFHAGSSGSRSSFGRDVSGARARGVRRSCLRIRVFHGGFRERGGGLPSADCRRRIPYRNRNRPRRRGTPFPVVGKRKNPSFRFKVRIYARRSGRTSGRSSKSPRERVLRNGRFPRNRETRRIPKPHDVRIVTPRCGRNVPAVGRARDRGAKPRNRRILVLKRVCRERRRFSFREFGQPRA